MRRRVVREGFVPGIELDRIERSGFVERGRHGHVPEQVDTEREGRGSRSMGAAP